MTSGDSGDAPEDINRTLPPSLAFILLNTSLSHMGDGVLPAHGRNMMGKKKKHQATLPHNITRIINERKRITKAIQVECWMKWPM